MITETNETTIIAGPIEEVAEASPLARKRRRRERLDFALPTINVIFLLMLYFLVAGTIVQKNELGVDPPETAMAPTDRLPRPLLSIANSGSMLLDGLPVSRTELIGAVQIAVGPDGHSDTLNILAPGGMAAGPMLDILSVLSTAHVPVRVVTVEKTAEGEGQ